MSRSQAVAPFLGVALVGVSFVGYAPARADGQVVFVPAGGPLAEVTGPVRSSLEIRTCTVRAEGVQVRGNISSEDENATVAVWDVDQNGSGVRAGQAYAWHAGLLPDAEVGDFVVVLPWRSPRLNFAVVETHDLIGHRHAAAVQRCPREPPEIRTVDRR
jgi:hypothetical protein